ncbi:MAG: dephospho-CoA kinase [Actinobacteria bacterium]|nr:dephospho-CoA kinase [Actinomycetota bacterium]
MLKVALTGGIGSGKSLAGEYFELIGATVIDSDQLARDVVERGTEGFDEILLAFGDEILFNGNLDRRKLARLIFDDPVAKAKLEEIVHPRIQSALENIVSECAPGTVLIYEIPLLFETGGSNRFDYVITVSAPLEIRTKRLLERGLKGYEIEKRLAAQASDVQRESIADCVFTNSGEADLLLRQVENIYEDVLLPKARENSK